MSNPGRPSSARELLSDGGATGSQSISPSRRGAGRSSTSMRAPGPVRERRRRDRGRWRHRRAARRAPRRRRRVTVRQLHVGHVVPRRRLHGRRQPEPDRAHEPLRRHRDRQHRVRHLRGIAHTCRGTRVSRSRPVGRGDRLRRPGRGCAGRGDARGQGRGHPGQFVVGRSQHLRRRWAARLHDDARAPGLATSGGSPRARRGTVTRCSASTTPPRTTSRSTPCSSCDLRFGVDPIVVPARQVVAFEPGTVPVARRGPSRRGVHRVAGAVARGRTRADPDHRPARRRPACCSGAAASPPDATSVDVAPGARRRRALRGCARRVQRRQRAPPSPSTRSVRRPGRVPASRDRRGLRVGLLTIDLPAEATVGHELIVRSTSRIFVERSLPTGADLGRQRAGHSNPGPCLTEPAPRVSLLMTSDVCRAGRR